MERPRDRKVFQEHRLANGARIFSYPDQSRQFVSMDFIVPLGNAHDVAAGRSIVPGTAHFLEHMLCERSVRFPGKNQLCEEFGLAGCEFNACTLPHSTCFSLSAPQAEAEWTIQALLEHLLSPQFLPADVDRERTIVANERSLEEPFFPGENRLTQYAATGWLASSPWNLREIFGDNDDLARMTPAYLRSVYQRYLATTPTVMIGGAISDRLLEIITRSLVAFCQSPPLDHPSQCRPPAWIRPAYHEYRSDNVATPLLFFGGLVPRGITFEDQVAIDFIGEYLLNDTHGPLYQWLRLDRGWCYSPGWFFDHFRESGGFWQFQFSVRRLRQVRAIRSELWGRIDAALGDQPRVSREVDRRRLAGAFQYEKLVQILTEAREELELWGRTISEQEQRAALETCRDPAYLGRIYEHYFVGEGVRGEFCAVPA